MTTQCWRFDKTDRLRDAAQHARQIRDALVLRRCDAVQAGDHHAVAMIDQRLAITVARFRRLGRLARAERYAARHVHA